MASAQSDQIDYAGKLGDVRASVRPNLQVSRHLFSGEPTYVVRDPVTAVSHRFAAEDYRLLVSINQSKTLKESLQTLIDQGTIARSQSDDYYRFVVHLHQLGLLTLPLSDGAALHKRFQQRQEAQSKGKVGKILFLKVPLAKPDRFLTYTQHLWSIFFTVPAFIVWLICAAASLAVVGIHWKEFIDPVGSMLALENLPVLWCLLVGLKVFHEFGHAYACKVFGGSVPEMGAIFIMGTPCAYVDASSSWGFVNRWHRMVVALAGMYFESMLAMVALVVWLLTDGGQLHSAAQYALILSTIVTVGFNANPLMRYDGYFVLSDLLDIPNLHRDAKASAVNFIKRLLFWIDPVKGRVSRNTHHPIRRFGMTVFGFACMVYQVSVSIGIGLLLGFGIPIVGPLIAGWMLLSPLLAKIKAIGHYLVHSDEITDCRGRAQMMTAGVLTVVVAVVTFLPIPGRLEVNGILHRSEERSVRADVDGFVHTVSAKSGERLRPNDQLYRLENDDLIAQRTAVKAIIDQLSIQLQSAVLLDHQVAQQHRNQLSSEQEKLKDLETRIVNLSVVSPIAGDFTDLNQGPKPGRYVRRGDPLGMICSGPWVIKAKLTADQWAGVASEVSGTVKVKLVGASGETLDGVIIQHKSSGSRQIDDAALTSGSGGTIAVTKEMMASENFFDLVVQVDALSDKRFAGITKVGMTAVLSVPTSRQTVGAWLYRRWMLLVHQLRLAST